MSTLSQKNESNRIYWPYLLLMVLAFCDKTILSYAVIAVNKISFLSAFSSFIKPVIYCTLIILIWLHSSRSIKISASYFIVPLFFIVAILFTALVYPANWQYISSALYDDILPCLPFFVLGTMFIADKTLMEWLGKASCLAILINVLYVFYYLSTREMSQDSMYWSYLLLPNVLFAIWYASQKKRAIPWLFAIVGMIYILAMGTRGPTVIVTIYLFLNYLFGSKKLSAIRIISVVMICAAAVLFYQSAPYYNLLTWTSETLKSINLSTRIIDSLLNEEFISQTSGRNDIFADVADKILQRPLLGYGIYGEWCWGYHSAHNMYLELMVHFGIPLGLTLLVSGISLIGYVFIKNNNYYAKSIILLWATHIFVQGIFGGSYLRYGVFFLIGFCLKELHTPDINHKKYELSSHVKETDK